MRALVLTDPLTGAPSRLTEVPDPVPGYDQVLVRIHTAALNHRDRYPTRVGGRLRGAAAGRHTGAAHRRGEDAAGDRRGPARHEHATQIFYVLAGTMTMRMAGVTHTVSARQCVTVPAGVAHQARNDGDGPVDFLVIASPPTAGDRVDLP